NTVVDYLKNRRERDLQIYDQYEIGLPRFRHRKNMLTYFPVEVIVEGDGKTRSGAISPMRRVCREHGFIAFTVKFPEGEVNPELKPAEEEAKPPPQGEAETTEQQDNKPR